MLISNKYLEDLQHGVICQIKNSNYFMKINTVSYISYSLGVYWVYISEIYFNDMWQNLAPDYLPSLDERISIYPNNSNSSSDIIAFEDNFINCPRKSRCFNHKNIAVVGFDHPKRDLYGQKKKEYFEKMGMELEALDFITKFEECEEEILKELCKEKII